MPVRLATTDDIPALARVINRAYVVEAHLFHGDRTDEAEVRERLEQPERVLPVIDAADGAPGATKALLTTGVNHYGNGKESERTQN